MIYDNYKKIEIEYIYPSSWRASIGIKTGRGIKRTTLKQKDIEFVKKTWGKDVNDDEADEKDDNFVLLILTGSPTMKSSKTAL